MKAGVQVKGRIVAAVSVGLALAGGLFSPAAATADSGLRGLCEGAADGTLVTVEAYPTGELVGYWCLPGARGGEDAPSFRAWQRVCEKPIGGKAYRALGSLFCFTDLP